MYLFSKSSAHGALTLSSEVWVIDLCACTYPRILYATSESSLSFPASLWPCRCAPVVPETEPLGYWFRPPTERQNNTRSLLSNIPTSLYAHSALSTGRVTSTVTDVITLRINYCLERFTFGNLTPRGRRTLVYAHKLNFVLILLYYLWNIIVIITRFWPYQKHQIFRFGRPGYLSELYCFWVSNESANVFRQYYCLSTANSTDSSLT